MFGVFRLLKNLRIPSSTDDKYYFDPKLMIFGSRVFESTETKGRVSQEEFDSLRAQMITVGGSSLSTAKCLMFLMFIVFPVCFLVFLARIGLLIAGTHLASYVTIIMIVVIIVPGIILSCLWARCSKSTHYKLQAMLAQRNVNDFKAKGVSFEIAPSLKYITISFQGTYNYNAAPVNMKPYDLA